MGASDFRSLMPSPSLFRLVGGCAILCAKYRISMVTAHSSSSSMRLLIPGAATQSCPFFASAPLLPASVFKLSAFPYAVISGLSTFTAGFTRYIIWCLTPYPCVGINDNRSHAATGIHGA